MFGKTTTWPGNPGLRNSRGSRAVLDRTHLARLGVDIVICEKCLNHTLGGLVDVYDRGDYFKERRDALELWANFLECCERGRPWNVEPLRAVA